MKEFKPHDYQKKAIDWAIRNEKCGLFLPMGAGKTVTTLTILEDLIQMEVSKVLIIGPVRVVKTTWPDEIHKWNHTKDLSYSLVCGTPKQRVKALHTKADIYLIGKENVAWLVNESGYKWDFDMVVIDELSTFKNHKSQRFKALRLVTPLIDRFIGLTGTPAPKGISDLWAQVYLMDRGQRLGKTVTQFRDRYLKPGRRNGMIIYEWVPQDTGEERIYEAIGDICMSLDPKDCAQLPPVQYLEKKVLLSKKALRLYQEFKQEKILEIGDSDEILAANAGVLCGLLLQYTSGEIYTRDSDGVKTGTTIIHQAKLDALDDLIESANGQPVMVFYYFKHEKDRILAHIEKTHKLEARALETEQDVRDWNDKKIDVLLLHPASAGHGLNLQKGGNVAVWYTLPNWNLELYQQANARIYRQGQENPVTIYHLQTEGTIDQDMLDALLRKDVTQKSLIEALRR